MDCVATAHEQYRCQRSWSHMKPWKSYGTTLKNCCS